MHERHKPVKAESVPSAAILFARAMLPLHLHTGANHRHASEARIHLDPQNVEHTLLTCTCLHMASTYSAAQCMTEQSTKEFSSCAPDICYNQVYNGAADVMQNAGNKEKRSRQEEEEEVS